MALDRSEVMEVHRRRARRHDFTANLYCLIGFRLEAYRRDAVGRLALRPGDTVNNATVSPLSCGFAYVATGEA